jgi:hypothetical protein
LRKRIRMLNRSTFRQTAFTLVCATSTLSIAPLLSGCGGCGNPGFEALHGEMDGDGDEGGSDATGDSADDGGTPDCSCIQA